MSEKIHHLIPTFHHDIAYLRPESWYTETATRILDKAISIMLENSDYTYTVEQAYFFDEYWNSHPETHDILKMLTERGQLHFAPGFSCHVQAGPGRRLRMLSDMERNFRRKGSSAKRWKYIPMPKPKP